MTCEVHVVGTVRGEVKECSYVSTDCESVVLCECHCVSAVNLCETESMSEEGVVCACDAVWFPTCES